MILKWNDYNTQRCHLVLLFAPQVFPAAVRIILCRCVPVTDARIPARVWHAVSASETISLFSARAEASIPACRTPARGARGTSRHMHFILSGLSGSISIVLLPWTCEFKLWTGFELRRFHSSSVSLSASAQIRVCSGVSVFVWSTSYTTDPAQCKLYMCFLNPLVWLI